MYKMNLSEGAILRIIENDQEQLRPSPAPLIQILDMEQDLDGDDDKQEDENEEQALPARDGHGQWHVVFTDGEYWIQAILLPRLVSFVTSKRLRKNSVCRLTEYHLSTTDDHHFVVMMNKLDVIGHHALPLMNTKRLKTPPSARNTTESNSNDVGIDVDVDVDGAHVSDLSDRHSTNNDNNNNKNNKTNTNNKNNKNNNKNMDNEVLLREQAQPQPQPQYLMGASKLNKKCSSNSNSNSNSNYNPNYNHGSQKNESLNEDLYQIFVRCQLNGKYRTYVVAVHETQCVHHIMADIARKIGIPCDVAAQRCRLFYESKRLQNGMEIRSTTLTNNCTLELTMPPIPITSDSNVNQSFYNVYKEIEALIEAKTNIEREIFNETLKLSRDISGSADIISLKNTFQNVKQTFDGEVLPIVYAKNQLKSAMHEKVILAGSMLDCVAYNPLLLKTAVQLEMKTIDAEIAVLQEKKVKLEKKNCINFWQSVLVRARFEDIKREHCVVTSQELGVAKRKLEKSFLSAMHTVEESCSEWSCDEFIQWLNIIEYGKFCDHAQVSILKKAIYKYKIDGNKISQLNGLFLDMIGVKDDEDRQLLIVNINRLLIKFNESKKSVCIGCTESAINTCIIPCGHQVYCFKCSKRQRQANCPICRTRITRVVQTYMQGFHY